MANATLLDAFNAAASFGQTALNIYDKKQMEVADADLRAQQLDLQVWQAQTLEEIQRSPDYENYDQMYNDALKKKYDEYNSASGASAYKNNYTAKMGNQLFSSLQANAKTQLMKAKENRMDMNRVETDKSYLSKLDQVMPAGQKKLDAKKDIYQKQFTDGVINEAQRNQYLEESAASEIMNTTTSYALNFLQNNQNLTEGEAMEVLSQYTSDLNVSVDGYEIPVDKNTFIQKGIKNAFNKIEEIQKQNNSEIKGQNTIILDDWKQGIYNAHGDEAKIDNICSSSRQKAVAQISMLRSKGPLEITEDDRRSRIDELEGVLKDIDQIKGLKKDGTKAALSKHLTLEEYVKQNMTILGNGQAIEQGIGEGYSLNGIINKFRQSFLQDEKDHITDWIQDAYEKGFDYSSDRAAYWDKLDNKLIEECANYAHLSSGQRTSIENARAFYLKETGLKKSDDTFNAWLTDTVQSIRLKDFKTDTELTDYLQKRTGDFIASNAMDFSKAYSAQKSFMGLNKTDKELYEISEKDLIKAVRESQNSELLWTEGNSSNMGDLTNQGDAEKIIDTLKTSNTSDALRVDLITNLNRAAGKNLKYTDCIDERIATSDDGSDLEAYLQYDIKNTGTDLDGKTLRYYVQDNKLILQSKPSAVSWGQAERDGDLKEIERGKYDDAIKGKKKEVEEQRKTLQEEAKAKKKEAMKDAKNITQEAKQAMKAKLNAQGNEVDKAVRMINAGYTAPDVNASIWEDMSLDDRVEYMYNNNLIK